MHPKKAPYQNTLALILKILTTTLLLLNPATPQTNTNSAASNPTKLMVTKTKIQKEKLLDPSESFLSNEKTFIQHDYSAKNTDKCSASYYFPFFLLNCPNLFSQGSVTENFRSINYASPKTLYMDGIDNMQIFVLDGLLHVTTYNKGVGFSYRVEDTNWVNKGSKFLA